jgi:hypothetical protein
MSNTTKTTTWVAGIIFSDWSLNEIASFLESEVNATSDDLGLMRIDRIKKRATNTNTDKTKSANKTKSEHKTEWVETSRTIVLVKTDAF